MRRPQLDREVLALLYDEPELLAIADAIVATQPMDRDKALNATPREQEVGVETGLRPPEQ